MFSKSKLLALLTAVGALALAPAAHAATDNTSVTLNGGTLDYTTGFAANDFPTTTLNGLPQVLTTNTTAWSVTDGRGLGALDTGAGWNVTIAASQFSGGGKTLPTGSMTLAVPSVPTTNVGNIAAPPVPQALVNPIDGGGAAQKMVSAAAGTGGGQWTFGAQPTALTLNVAPGVQAGTYTSTITTTLAAGP
jgi:hypothetical protein